MNDEVPVSYFLNDGFAITSVEDISKAVGADAWDFYIGILSFLFNDEWKPGDPTTLWININEHAEAMGHKPKDTLRAIENLARCYHVDKAEYPDVGSHIALLSIGGYSCVDETITHVIITVPGMRI